ncbi:helix-turn-helix domain-containing protein [Nocardia paucivorans]|uniref:helix-turn-helix domain-containing protein n=1 Tax=Nocardia paucivorans TaxID=114259 RepID=UPI0002EF8251|nr:helix-turn-helix domain-containing protein [Nocardia paucivorans]
MSDEQIRQARALLTRLDESVSSIARLLGVSRTTLYKYLPEFTGSRPEPAVHPIDKPRLLRDVSLYT